MSDLPSMRRRDGDDSAPTGGAILWLLLGDILALACGAAALLAWIIFR